MQLEFHNLLQRLNSPLKNYIPSVLASGILLYENGSYIVIPWDGRSMPDRIAISNLMPLKHNEGEFPFGVWGKKQFEHQMAGSSSYKSRNCNNNCLIWPYIVTKRCQGKIFAEL